MHTLARSTYSLFLLLALLLACREEEQIYPDIELLGPTPQLSLTFGDTLFLDLQVRSGVLDDYSLLQGDIIQTLPGRIIDRGGGRYSLELVFSDPYLPSGSYDLRVRARNGQTSRSRFFSVQYTTLPATLTGVAVLGEDALWLRDTANRSLWQQPVAEDFEAVIANRREQSLLLLHKQKSLPVLDLRDGSVLYRLEGEGGQRAVKVQQGGYWLLHELGRVSFHRGSASPQQQKVLSPNERFLALEPIGDDLALLRRELGNNQNQLEIYRNALLNLRQTLALGPGHYHLNALNEKDLVLFRYHNGQSQLSIFNIEQGTQSFQSANSSRVVASAKRPDGSLVFSNAEGIYLFSPPSNVKVRLLKQDSFDALAVSQIDGRIFVLHQNAVKVLNDRGELVYFAAAPPGAHDLALIYNK